MKLLLFLLLSATSLCAQTPIFNGKDFDGWDIRQGEEKWWRVEEGVIIGGSLTEKVPYNTFVATTKSYQNFDLSLKVKLTKGEGFMNSGVQIRSTRVPNNSEMCGYQVDAGIGWWGKLYDESRRNRVVGTPIDPAALKPNDWDWNDYRILCEGRRIRTWINGVAALDYTEEDPAIPIDGLIGMQTHGGGKFLVHFKDIIIKELPATPVVQAAAEPKMEAIEHAKPKTPQEQQAAFHLAPGFEIELVAAEDPEAGVGKFVSVYFDQRGRMWTQTALEYPVDANENAAIADALYASKARDKILIYNRENVFEKPLPAGGLKPDHTFADGLAIPLGILPWGDGASCYAQHGRDIVLLKDTDNDNIADQRDVILTGFGVQDSHLFPHQFTRAPGGWIWMAQGAFNSGTVKRPGDPDDQAIQFDRTRMGKFRPDGSEFEITSNGPCNIWGLVIDRNGESFIQEANDFGYGVMPFHDYGNYPGCSDGVWKSYAPEFPGTFVKQRFGGTGLSGLCLTDADGAFPVPYGNLMLVANPITSRINTVEMRRDQPSPDHYLTDWQFSKLNDFVTCDDPWFRPVGMTLGPDGSVYIVDWYNKIISHNEVPRIHPDRDKIRGRIWRIKHSQQKPFAVPDFTKLSETELTEKLKSPSLAQTHLAAQTLADRRITPATIDCVAALWTHPAPAETLEALAASQSPDLRREAARSMASLEILTPGLRQLRHDPVKNVRREAINSLGYLLGKLVDKNPVFLALLDFDAASLDAPMAPSTRGGGKVIRVREAYDREFERYLVRLFCERHPVELSSFLSTDPAKKLGLESQLLASLALPPEQGAAIIAGQLGQLKRAPNDEEVLRLVQAIDQPAIQQSLRASITNPATSQTIVDALLKNKNRISPASIQSLVGDTVEKLFQGNAGDLRRGIELSAAFALSDTSPRLHQIAISNADQPTILAALDAITSQQNAIPQTLAPLLQHRDDVVRLAALRAIASSRQPGAGDVAIKALPGVASHLQAQIIEALCTHQEGARAIVNASLDGENFSHTALSSMAINRLQTVLGTDPQLDELLTKLGDQYRAVLDLNGSAEAFIPTTISFDGPFTIETWVKLRPGIDQHDSLGGAPGQLDLNFYAETFRVFAGSHGGDILVAKKKIAPELWTHVAATRDEKGTFRIYINGELDNASQKASKHRIENFRVGWSTLGGTQGQFAEYRIWNRERSAEEIRACFDRSLSAGDSALLYHGSGDQGWGTLPKALSLPRTTDLPPVMSLEQSAAFDKKYQHFLSLTKAGGNAAEGKNLAVLCIACHQFGNAGGNIGPNLSSVGSMGPEAIVRNILTPNAAIEPGYRIFRVALKDGSLLDAFFVSEDKDAIVIRQLGVGEKRIERKDIASTQFLRQSLMPDGLIDGLSDQQRKDLFAYLMSLK